MKTILIFLVAIIIPFARAQEISSSLSVTNVVKSPITMSGLIGTRSRNSTNAVTRHTEHAVMDGLRALKTSQNDDGSWGAEEYHSLATPLVLTAFLCHGESTGSEEFGTTVADAHDWIMASTVSNNAERIAMIVALSEYDLLHYNRQSRNLARCEIEKVKEAMAKVVFQADDPWTDYLALHLTAPEVERPTEINWNRDCQLQWGERTVDLEPLAINGYVALCATSLGKFRRGGQPWATFNTAYAPKTIQRQTKDGFWPCADQEDRFACTALTIESMTVYYAFRKWYWPELQSEREQEVSQEIKVEVK